MKKIATGLVLMLVLLSVATCAHIAWAFVQPPSDSRRVATQVNFVRKALAQGAGARMQALFPEGEFFSEVLSGLAATQSAITDQRSKDQALAIGRQALARIDQPDLQTRFGSNLALDHGVFYRGWRLQLLVELARLSHDNKDLSEVAKEASAIASALDAAPTGVPASYPDQYWPCDAIVAMSAASRAEKITSLKILDGIRPRWLQKINNLRDPELKLLPHQIDRSGQIRVGPRGSSGSIIVSYWPDVDQASAGPQWIAFRQHFLTRQLGLLGVKEHPDDRGKPGDVDSGPLIFGISASASAVTLAAARRMGDQAVISALDGQAEFLGLPLQLRSQRSFLGGVLPVGDAFVAWSRSFERANSVDYGTTKTPIWPLWCLLSLLPGLAALGWWIARRRRQRWAG